MSGLNNGFSSAQQPSIPFQNTRFNPAQLQGLTDLQQRQLAVQRAIAAGQMNNQTQQSRPQPTQYQSTSGNTLLSSSIPNRHLATPQQGNTYRGPLPSGQNPSSPYTQNTSNSNYSNVNSTNSLGYSRPNPVPPRVMDNSVYRSQYSSSNDYDSGYIRRRDDGGMRGTMRAEIGKLMYAAGDVQDPDSDSLDYMEDLVVDFLSDLCRPVPPIKTSNSTILPALTVQILRRRLSHPSMSKYLHRFDHMVYMNKELQASRNVGMPSNQDLINIAGKEFLGLNEENVEKKKVGRPKRVVEGGADGEVATGSGSGKEKGKNKEEKGERKKPGPKPGWKRRLIEGSTPPRKKSVKREKTANP